MRLVPYSREVEKFDSMFNMMDDFFNNSLSQQQSRGFKLDIVERDDSFVIEGELPGIERENIKIAFENNLLKISVEQEEATEEKKYIHKERRQYKMERVIRFKEVDPDNIQAKLDKGILVVTLPKKENLESKKMIEIQ